jgi:hypothetical protein
VASFRRNAVLKNTRENVALTTELQLDASNTAGAEIAAENLELH